MSRMRTWLALLAAVSFTPAIVAAQAIPAPVLAAVKDPGRPPADIARDPERYPAEIVAFAGVRSGDKVVDLVPGNGYFTRIISKVAGSRGRVYPYVPIAGGNAQQIRARERDALRRGETPVANPVDQVLAIQNIQPEYGNVMVFWQTVATIGLPEQVDVVFVADAYRGLRNGEFGAADISIINRAIFNVLKPGGALVIVDDSATTNVANADASAAGFIGDGTALTIGNRVAVRLRKPANVTGDRRPRGDPLKAWYGNTFTLGTLTERNRTIFHHADGTYQEFGLNDMQSGYWFWAADGRNCMLHQFPVEQRGFVTCHQYPVTEGAKAIGEMWIEGGPMHLTPYKEGDPRPAPGQGNVVGLTQGYVYPNAAAAPRGQGPARGAAPPAGPGGN